MNGPENLAREVKLARIRVGFERANAFAESLGLTPKTISNIETGARASYSAVTLVKLDTALGWEPGTARSLLDGEIATPKLVGTTQSLAGDITVGLNAHDEQIEIEAPDVRVTIAVGLIQLEADYWDKFNWSGIPPAQLIEAGYRARAEFMSALDEIKVRSLGLTQRDETPSVREMHMEDVRDDIIRAEAAEDWTEEDQLAAENDDTYESYLAQADAKREQFERGDDWDLAAKQHRDPSEGAN